MNSRLDQSDGLAGDQFMTSKLRVLIQAAIMITSIVFAAPQAGGQDPDVLISRALKISGINAQVRALDQTVLSLLPADTFPDSRTRDRVAKSLTKAIDDEALLALVHNSVKENFRQESLDEVLEFYHSRLGQKVGRLQSTALDPSVLRGIREGRRAVVMLEGARLEALKRIMRSGRVIESNPELLRSFVWGFVEGFSAQAENQSGMLPLDLAAIGNASAFSAERTEDVAMLALANTFQSLSDKEMEQLAAYQESEAAVWFHTAVVKGMAAALYQTARALGTSLSNLGETTPAPGKQR